MSDKELLLRVEHVKYRMPGAAKSPIGTFYVYGDRVEWFDNGSDEKLVILFNDIRGKYSVEDLKKPVDETTKLEKTVISTGH